MDCPNCGNQLKEEAKFCTKCGTATVPAPVAGVPIPRGNIPGPPPSGTSARIFPGSPVAKTKQSQGVPPPPTGVPAPPPSAQTSVDDVSDASAGEGFAFQAQPEKHPINIKMVIAAAGILVAAAIIFSIARFIAGLPPRARGPQHDKLNKYVITLPKNGWFTRDLSADDSTSLAAEFFTGRFKPHDATLRILKAELSQSAPDIIPDVTMWKAQPYFTEEIKKIVAQDGYLYKNSESTIINIGGRRGFLFKGTAENGPDKKKMRFFLAMKGNRSFYLWFTYGPAQEARFDPEINAIGNSFKFE